MTEIRRNNDPSPATRSPARGSAATSLFGGAILATVATGSIAQTVLNSASAFGTTTVPIHQFVVLTGYSIAGDGGGGIFVPGPSGGTCTQDFGLVFLDATPKCFFRANPTNSVREWGAFCDVVAGASGNGQTAVFTPGTPGGHGTLTVTTTLLAPTPPRSGQYIALSQVGGPTLWSTAGTGATVPAVSMTRFSTLGGTQTLYSAGDLVSFTGTSNPGSFSQQAAIIVDSVKTTISGGTTYTGVIDKWHFLWGGLYDPTVGTDTVFNQDTAHSHCLNNCGTASGQAGGATMTPAWSGWSVLNRQPIQSGGTGYAVGDIVTLSGAGSFTNQGHLPKLIVEGTTTTIISGVTYTGWVTAYDWLDYGSYSTLTSTGTLTDNTTLSSPSGLTFSPVAWTQGGFSTTIVSVTPSSPNTVIILTDNPPFPGTMNIQYFYYGDDDSGAINRAIQAAPKGGLVIPAGCGTTQTLNLSTEAAAGDANMFFRGGNLQSAGFYTFAAPMASRNSAPVLPHVIQSGTLSGSSFLANPGGGFGNMFVEGLGIPQGYGYYLMGQSGVTAPSGFEAAPTPPSTAPTAGNVVEIDAASQLRIDKVLISDGGIGPGNSVLQCGIDEANPSHYYQNASIIDFVLTDSRLDGNEVLSGPTDPDFIVRLDAGCHDGAFDALTAYDGTKADILVYGANRFSRTHLNSDAANTDIGVIGTITWSPTTSFGLAGLADYGFYVIGNTSISDTQCDIANVACALTIPNPLVGAYNAGQITNMQMKCGGFGNTPGGYTGVELSAGTINTTVGGTASSGRCNINPYQLVRLDGPIDFSTSLCNNSSVPLAGCTGYQGGFAANQFYTQPTVTYGTVALAGSTITSSGTLYAVPFFAPAGGGTITRLALQVNVAGGSGAQCDVGIYNAFSGAPTSLIQDFGPLTVTSTGSISTTLGTISVELAPATLYFLAVGCNGTVSVEGVTSSGGLTVPLTGAPDFLTTIPELTAPWGFAANMLPGTFTANGTLTIASGGSIPNVYARP